MISYSGRSLFMIYYNEDRKERIKWNRPADSPDNKLFAKFVEENDLYNVVDKLMTQTKSRYLTCVTNSAYFKIEDPNTHQEYADYTGKWIEFELENGVNPQKIKEALDAERNSAINDRKNIQVELDQVNKRLAQVENELAKCENLYEVFMCKMIEKSNSATDKKLDGSAAQQVMKKAFDKNKENPVLQDLKQYDDILSDNKSLKVCSNDGKEGM